MVLGNCIWFRQDLRIYANPAVDAARKKGERIVALYAMAPQTWKAHDWGTIKEGFVRERVMQLKTELRSLDIELYILELQAFADIPAAFEAFFEQHHITDFYVNRHYGLDERRCELGIQKRCAVKWHYFNGNWLLAPEKTVNQQGKPYQVFTAYKRQVLSQLPPYFESVLGNGKAEQQLHSFCKNELLAYQEQRDFPHIEGTSRLSHYLAQGILSPRQCVRAMMQALKKSIPLRSYSVCLGQPRGLAS